MCFTCCYSCLPALPAQSALNQINPDHFHGNLEGYWCCGPQGWWEGWGAWGETRHPVILLLNFNAKVLIFFFTIHTMKHLFSYLLSQFHDVIQSLFKCCRKSAQIVILLSVLLSYSCLQQVRWKFTYAPHLITAALFSVYATAKNNATALNNRILSQSLSLETILVYHFNSQWCVLHGCLI